MIAQDGILRCTALNGTVRVEASAQVPLEALYTGSVGRPSWEELKAIGPFRFGIDQDAAIGAATTSGITRDFGDSSIRCSSGMGATTYILSIHNPSPRQHIPAAMGFAFAQQWARNGHLCVHGALLQVEGKGVLVVGLRAAGKSVLSASALAAGGRNITDDFFLLGEKDDVILGERIRRFLSLRRSWAADALVKDFPGEWSPDRSGRRVFLRVKEDDDRFPQFSRIDRIWVLKRPRAGRRAHSSLESISQAEVYASLVSAIQPLLLGPEFPHERAKLQALLGKLMSSVPAARIETGQDIVLDPKGTWARLLGST